MIVHACKIVSQAFNLRETLQDPTAHAERLAITLAGRALGSWRLEGCTLYVTLEPCPMSPGQLCKVELLASFTARPDPKAGACASLYRLVSDPRLNHRASLTAGVMEQECGEILSLFFQDRRVSSKLN